MFGEDIAARFLKKRGYRILERNYRCRMGEIDIIAMKGGVLFFVEVKTRRDTHRGHPLESITLRKQRQVIKISEFFLMSYKREVSCRYAVIGVLLDQNGDSRIDFLPDAFTT